MMDSVPQECFAERFPREARVLRWLVVFSAILLGVGLTAPIMTVEKFYVFENTLSVFSGVTQLLHEKKILLFLIVAGFSVFFPVMKLAVLLKLVSPNLREPRKIKKYLRLMHHYGKWSMLDVFVVAVLVVSVKLGALATVKIRYGLYVFAASVILTMFVTARLYVLSERAWK